MRKLMSKKLIILAVATLCTVTSFGQSKNIAFDPLLDTSCKVLEQPQAKEWNSTYMWYPGQLSAHMQKRQKQKSLERCTYVGYPGKFNKDAYHSSFRKKVKLAMETTIEWDGPSNIICIVDGQQLSDSVPPVVGILHGIFGFSQSDKNISDYTLSPQLLDLEWAKGRIPLKEGFIKLDIRRNGISHIEIPSSCTVSLKLTGLQKPLVFKKAGIYEFRYKE